tara:strand:+ start:284 stop:562 length:279 start_codon:yes stop_codon:yes gene_type:complete
MMPEWFRYLFSVNKKGNKHMANPLSKLADVIQEDYKKIEEHSVASLKEVLTTDIEHYGFDNKNISDNDVDLLLKLVGNIIKSKCQKVYHNQI